MTETSQEPTRNRMWNRSKVTTYAHAQKQWSRTWKLQMFGVYLKCEVNVEWNRTWKLQMFGVYLKYEVNVEWSRTWKLQMFGVYLKYE